MGWKVQWRNDRTRHIGGGAYGEVWLARNKATRVLRAAKVIWRRTFEDDPRGPYDTRSETITSPGGNTITLDFSTNNPQQPRRARSVHGGDVHGRCYQSDVYLDGKSGGKRDPNECLAGT